MTGLFPETPFEEYDLKHPAIWKEFKDLTFRLITKGITHYGAKAICEVIRFHKIIDHQDYEFKVNNNFTAGYARKFMEQYPEYEGFFETRKIK